MECHKYYYYHYYIHPSIPLNPIISYTMWTRSLVRLWGWNERQIDLISFFFFFYILVMTDWPRARQRKRQSDWQLEPRSPGQYSCHGRSQKLWIFLLWLLMLWSMIYYKNEDHEWCCHQCAFILKPWFCRLYDLCSPNLDAWKLQLFLKASDQWTCKKK